MLEVLILKSNSISEIGCAALCEALNENHRINHFDISDNSVNDKGGMAIAKMLRTNTGLANLAISGCKFSASSLIALLISLKESNYIQKLDISNNAINSARLSNSLWNDIMNHLSIMIRDNTLIKALDISKMHINDDAVVSLMAPALKFNNTIENLNLAWYPAFINYYSNRIGRDGGVALFKALSSNFLLQVLNLSCNALQDEGAEAMAQLLSKNASLEEYNHMITLDYI
jgi:Ran GTPase-activating protein (RanGAP) involved in mRNA processing and transport